MSSPQVLLRRIAAMAVLTLMVSTLAQAKKLPGKIVHKDGGVSDVTLRIPFKFLSFSPNYEGMQYRVVYFDHNNERQVVRPDEVREIHFEIKGEVIRMVAVRNSLEGTLFNTNTHLFLRLLIDGPRLRLFRYYFTTHSPGMMTAGGAMSPGHTYSVDNEVLQLDDGPLMHPRGIAFRKDMLRYLTDCPEVTRLIESRDLRRNDLEVIVHEYNKKCGGSEW